VVHQLLDRDAGPHWSQRSAGVLVGLDLCGLEAEYRRGAAPPVDEIPGKWRHVPDIATVGIVHSRAARSGGGLNNRLQQVLRHRLTIEQAHAFLAKHGDINLDSAATVLRDILLS
jgi:hypothetical protein